MNESPLDMLIHAYFDSTLDEAGQGEFAKIMVESEAARHRFWELAEIHGLAQDACRAAAAAGMPITLIPSHCKPLNWVQRHPLAAVAAGVVFGMLSASILLTYGSSWRTKHALPLAHAGFEGPQEPLAKLPVHTNPVQHGVWTGDGEMVEARPGTSRVEGKQMLRFLLSSAGPAKYKPGGVGRGASVTQLIDLRPWRKQIASGTAAVLWSAAFNGDKDADSKKTFYRIDVRACVENPHIDEDEIPLLQHTGTDGLTHIAHEFSRVVADNDPSKWQTLSGSMALPRKTDFIAIHLRVFQDDYASEDFNAPIDEDIWHVADKIQLSLISAPGHRPLALIAPSQN